MKITLLICFAAVVLAGCSSIGKDCDYENRDCTSVIASADVVKQKLRVCYHTKTNLDNQCVDCILANATQILQTKDGADDVACSVRLVRKGDVTAFNARSGSIDSQADFNAIMGLPGDVKLVDEINWCGRYVVAYGCAQQNKSIAVVPIGPDKAGILWAHEYSHVKGRGRRNADSVLMHAWPNPRNKQVDKAEYRALRK